MRIENKTVRHAYQKQKKTIAEIYRTNAEKNNLRENFGRCSPAQWGGQSARRRRRRG